MPSSELPGGMRMSVTTTSGLHAIDGLEQRLEVAADGDDLEPGLGLEQAPHALADEVVVLREHDPDRHGRRIRR